MNFNKMLGGKKLSRMIRDAAVGAVAGAAIGGAINQFVPANLKGFAVVVPPVIAYKAGGIAGVAGYMFGAGGINALQVGTGSTTTTTGGVVGA